MTMRCEGCTGPAWKAEFRRRSFPMYVSQNPAALSWRNNRAELAGLLSAFGAVALTGLVTSRLVPTGPLSPGAFIGVTAGSLAAAGLAGGAVRGLLKERGEATPGANAVKDGGLYAALGALAGLIIAAPLVWSRRG